MWQSSKLYVILLLFLSLFIYSAEAKEGPSSTRIMKFTTYDEGEVTDGGTGTFAIDSVQADCDESEDEEDLEPFFDTTLGITVQNNHNREILFTRARIRLRYNDDSRRRIVRYKTGIITNMRAPGSGKETEVRIFFLDARDGQKVIPGKNVTLPDEAGFSAATIRLRGRTDDGQRVRVRGRFTTSIGDVDRCS